MQGLEHKRSTPEQLTADPGELVQQLKSQLLPGDKALSKNQRKKARKKVSKLLHKTLDLPRASSDVNALASPENGSALIMSEDTGCSGRHQGWRTSDAPACTSARLAGGTAPHPPPSTSLHPPVQRVMARAPGDSPGLGELPSAPPPKRRRVQNDGSLASGLGTAPTQSHHTTSRNLEGASAAAAAGPSSGGGGGVCSSSQLSRGAQKRLSRRQAQPEDLLTADDGNSGGSGGMNGTASGAVTGARSSGGDGASGVAHTGRRKRDWEQQQQRVKQRVHEGPGSRRRGKGGQAAIAVAGSSLASGASEEVVQRPQTVGTAASAAAAAVAVVHRVVGGGGSDYAMYGGVLAAAAAAPTRPLLGLAVAGGLAAGASSGGADAAAAARGPVDFSAALLMMRVQLRSSGVATLSSGGEGTAGGAGESMLDTESAAGTAIGAGGSGVAAVAVAAAAITSPGAMDMNLQTPEPLEPEEGTQTKTQQMSKQYRRPEGQAGAKQPVQERAALNRYGNYHRYYGYRLGSELDKDPRVKLMKPEWFQQRVCVDVGCNEGLVTLAVAARFGVKRMTGYDIDGTLIKKACKNLRVMRSEYTARLQALSRGGAGAGIDALGVGGASQDEDNDVPGVGAADGDDVHGGQHAYGDHELHSEQPDVVGPSDAGGDNTAYEPHGDQDKSDGDGGDDGDGGGDGDGNGNEGLAVVEQEAEAQGVNGSENALRHGGEGGGGPTGPASAGRPVRSRPAAASGGTLRGPPLAAGPPPLHVGLLRSFVRSLAGTRFVQQDWANGRGRPESADTIMCLSVTKWVHLNNGDEGLKRLFKKFFDTLTPGGLLVLEPQPWKSYKRAVHKTTTNAVPFKRIEQLQLRPQHFVEYLTNVVGFVLEAQLHEGGGAGFDRPLFLLRKPAP